MRYFSNCRFGVLSQAHFLARKASASVLAVDERQSLETLTRDAKTASRSLTQLKEKHQDHAQKRDKLAEDVRVHSDRKSEVWHSYYLPRICLDLSCTRAVGREAGEPSKRSHQCKTRIRQSAV